jgi:hypothetical protein
MSRPSFFVVRLARGYELQGAAILEKALAEHPDHPGALHYLIHAYDHTPLAARGLAAARRYAAIAPSAPHALQIPSHIFAPLGLWQESIEANRVASNVDGRRRHSPLPTGSPQLPRHQQSEPGIAFRVSQADLVSSASRRFAR